MPQITEIVVYARPTRICLLALGFLTRESECFLEHNIIYILHCYCLLVLFNYCGTIIALDGLHLSHIATSC